MGNRAIIKPKDSNIGVYLHWNGGINSVTAFLEYCKLKGYRDFGGKNADGYGVARFVQVVSNFFGGGDSIGIEKDVKETEVYAKGLDNGIYVIDGWDIVKRICGNNIVENYSIQDMLISIDEAQPTKEQLGKEFFESELVDVSDLNIGDKVYVYDGLNCKYNKHIVVGIGYKDSIVNGYNVENIPIIDKYCNDNGSYRDNANNYLLRVDKVRRYEKAKEIVPRY